MSAGDAVGLKQPPEFQSALEKLHRLFAGALHDAKFNSCWSGWNDIQRTKSTKKKIEILKERFEEWREGSAKGIREWLPKFVSLATAYSEVIDDDPIHWAKGRVWETVEGMCGIRRPRDDEPLGIDDVLNRVTVWWFAVASEGNPKVNVPPLRRWSAPRWLASDRQGTNELLEKHTSYLWLRVNCVINEAIDLAEIQRVITPNADGRDRVAVERQRPNHRVPGTEESGSRGEDVWRELRAEFEALRKEESSDDFPLGKDRWVMAHSQHSMTEWLVSGASESLRTRAELLAARAGGRLGPVQGSTKLDQWLHRLYLELRATHSKLLFEPSGGSPVATIIRVCEASATYCARLEREAIETAASKSNWRPAKPAEATPQEKLDNPAKFPTMTVPEVMALVQISRASVYRFLNEGRLNRPGLNKKPGKRSRTLVLTASVQKMLKPAED